MSIIGNALDNAIEACEELPVTERFIKVALFENPLEYSFVYTNSYDREKIAVVQVILQKGGSVKGKARGQGLEIMKKLTAKYQGHLGFCNDAAFYNLILEGR